MGLKADMEREFNLDAQAAIAYGLVDEIAATQDSRLAIASAYSASSAD